MRSIHQLRWLLLVAHLHGGYGRVAPHNVADGSGGPGNDLANPVTTMLRREAPRMNQGTLAQSRGRWNSSRGAATLEINGGGVAVGRRQHLINQDGMSSDRARAIQAIVDMADLAQRNFEKMIASALGEQEPYAIHPSQSGGCYSPDTPEYETKSSIEMPFCRALCDGDPACKAISYKIDGGQECQLWKTPPVPHGGRPGWVCMMKGIDSILADRMAVKVRPHHPEEEHRDDRKGGAGNREGEYTWDEINDLEALNGKEPSRSSGGRAVRSGFDCAFDLDRWSAWEENKKSYCCQQYNVACVSVGQNGVGPYSSDPTHASWAGDAKCICGTRSSQHGQKPLPHPLLAPQDMRTFAENTIACAGMNAWECKDSVRCQYQQNPLVDTFPKCTAKRSFSMDMDVDKCGWAAPMFKGDPCVGLHPCPKANCYEVEEADGMSCDPQKVCISKEPPTHLQNLQYPESLILCMRNVEKMGLDSDARKTEEMKCLYDNIPDDCSVRSLMHCELQTSKDTCGSVSCSWQQDTDCKTHVPREVCRPSFTAVIDMLTGTPKTYARQAEYCLDMPQCNHAGKTGVVEDFSEGQSHQHADRNSDKSKDPFDEILDEFAPKPKPKQKAKPIHFSKVKIAGLKVGPMSKEAWAMKRMREEQEKNGIFKAQSVDECEQICREKADPALKADANASGNASFLENNEFDELFDGSSGTGWCLTDADYTPTAENGLGSNCQTLETMIEFADYDADSCAKAHNVGQTLTSYQLMELVDQKCCGGKGHKCKDFPSEGGDGSNTTNETNKSTSVTCECGSSKKPATPTWGAFFGNFSFSPIKWVINVLTYLLVYAIAAMVYNNRVVSKIRPIPGLPKELDPQADFHRGCGDCCGDGAMCFHAVFCTYCREAHTLQVAGLGSYVPMFFLFVFSCCLQPFVACYCRMQLRKQLGLRPNPFVDFLLSWCCATCSVAQQAYEVDKLTGVQVKCVCSLVMTEGEGKGEAVEEEEEGEEGSASPFYSLVNDTGAITTLHVKAGFLDLSGSDLVIETKTEAGWEVFLRRFESAGIIAGPDNTPIFVAAAGNADTEQVLYTATAAGATDVEVGKLTLYGAEGFKDASGELVKIGWSLNVRNGVGTIYQGDAPDGQEKPTIAEIKKPSAVLEQVPPEWGADDYLVEIQPGAHTALIIAVILAVERLEVAALQTANIPPAPIEGLPPAPNDGLPPPPA